MDSRKLPEPLAIFPQILKWIFISVGVGGLAGSASAGFLFSLDWATDFREGHRWIIAFLPLAGFFIGWIYHRFGKSVEAGNNLIIDEIHEPKNPVPLRMTPLVLLGTVLTHLFGGSAGREGTAVQMGASLADQLNRPLRLKGDDRKLLLMAGLSAGFGSVFGTPLAGAIFGLEVLSIGRMQYSALLPCVVASITADAVTKLWGIHHTIYVIPISPAVNPQNLVLALACGAIFGIVGMLFASSTHGLSRVYKSRISYAPFRPFVGGGVVALLVLAMGSTRYIGLGIPAIVESFNGLVPSWDFAVKFILTVITLGAGFKGGEVTPLFFIGATLGNALSRFIPLPFPLLAGMGFVAVFAGAANTPISSTLLAIELFGAPSGMFCGLACVASYLFSGHAGIYRAQRIEKRKF